MSFPIEWLLPSILLILSQALPSFEDELSGLQSCVDSFSLHRDKIIKADDSREMGAKFLGEIDVDSRIGCMKWCCESKHCDVFVFEERKPGSCYLFHCGPPHDFKCKFTTHSNYSSAVLTNYDLQNAAALEEEVRRNQQEHELQSLRRQDSPGREYNSYFGESSSTTNLPPPAPPQSHTTSTTSTTPAPFKGPTCNRNQFECRSNEDCIAIYNVCDGIPQCPDGSDEAAELSCPPERTTPAPAPQPPPPALQPKPPFDPAAALIPELIRYQQMMEQQQQQQQQHHAQYPMVYPDQVVGPMRSHHLAPTAEDFRLYQQQQQQQQMQIPPLDDQSNSAMISQQQQPMSYNLQPPLGYQWSNYQSNGAYNTDVVNKMPNQAQAPPVEPTVHGFQQPFDQEPQPVRIFNHNKKPGTHLEDIETPNGAYSAPDPNHNNYGQYQPAGAVDSWQDNTNAVNQAQQQQQHQVQSGHEANSAPVLPHQRQQTQQQPPPSEKQVETTRTRQESSSYQEKSVQRADFNRQNDAEQPEAKQPKSASSQAQIAAAAVTATITHDTPEQQSPQRPPQQQHQQQQQQRQQQQQPQQVQQMHAMPPEAHLEQHKSLAIEDHIRRHGGIEDLEMSRPRGAVISLALGLCVTAIMAVLIACRLRVVKRRGLRLGRHDAYAHDADYLVNGMYL